MRWHERYLIVYCYSLALVAICGQQQRINKAQTPLFKLADKPGDELEQLDHFTYENGRVSLSATLQAVQDIISPHPLINE
ncbi:hypothetical protein LC612_13755 [Nostoc sp. CHAB 5834]|nr:hypothetical protein [Nostoc sp. CHAB 5834]